PTLAGVKRAAAATLAVMLLAACGSDREAGEAPAPQPPAYRLDGTLRLNQIQVLGTHNSYHVAPSPGPTLTPDRDITQAPLRVQLERQSVRQIELDVHATAGGPLAVFHLRGDEGTTCPTFVACLREVREWSASHRGHVPLFVLVEPKHEVGALVDGLAVDAEIRSVFSPDQLLAPDDVQGRWPSLRQAVQEGGWPVLGSVRDKVVFVYNDEVLTRSAYTTGETSLQGRAMFVYASPPSPIAAVTSVPDARLEPARITGLVRAGFIVRTRADDSGVEARANDPSRAQAALASGAQLVSTDFPAPAPSGYVVPAPGNPARCNPVTAPPEMACSPEDVERLR
ncbi:MAG: phosphatidylinositol-specific phospholipase C1-like protein, partial [Actinomycetota bacterium]|nr:phosphatidylinositol-specific phospholipase C1-like protein [Actinomycetota bacterium]